MALWYPECALENASTKTVPIQGPVVRIAPNQVSIKDADTYLTTIYRQASKFRKVMRHGPEFLAGMLRPFQDPAFYDVFANEDDTVFTVSSSADHSYHRRLLSGGFARKKVLEFEPEVWKLITKMTNLINDEYASGKPVDLTKLFRSLTLDVVSCFSFGESYEALSRPALDEPLLDAFDKFSRASYLVRLTAFSGRYFGRFSLITFPANEFSDHQEDTTTNRDKTARTCLPSYTENDRSKKPCSALLPPEMADTL